MQVRRLVQLIVLLGIVVAATKFNESRLVKWVAAGAEPAHQGPYEQTEEAASPDSCAQPSPANKKHCETLEQQIMDSVVRLEYRLGDEIDGGGRPKRISHGTIKDGRYLVIHNHFVNPLEHQQDRADGEMNSLAVYKANGRLLYMHTGASTIAVAAEEEETLVLDFGVKDNGQGFFDWLAVPSAPFKSWQEVPLKPDDEVAQVNYDGQKTFLTWTTIMDVQEDSGVPRIVVSNGLSQGASGGGVFWNGHHIANNWINWELLESAGEGGNVLDQASIAALNSPSVANIHLQ
jgi:hypothetical protein